MFRPFFFSRQPLTTADTLGARQAYSLLRRGSLTVLESSRAPTWWRAPESAGLELAREGELRAAQLRLVVAITGALTVSLAPSHPTSIYVTGYALMFVV